MSAISKLQSAALNTDRISGLTHTFYSYPARFSPVFVRAAIEHFTKPGELVLDPFMGGGTTPVEALSLGRRVIGTDLNELSLFVANVKTNVLSSDERRQIEEWLTNTVPFLNCRQDIANALPSVSNMHLPKTRWIKKTIAILLASIEEELSVQQTKDFARCAILQTGKWALNGRRNNPSARAFRSRVVSTTVGMLKGISEFHAAISAHDSDDRATLVCADAESLASNKIIQEHDLADFIVTSPPYPGVHILYHRWQVDGRKETNAAYWIANCQDGQGSLYYNFGDRRQGSDSHYFERADRVYRSLRNCVKDGARVVQLMSFSNPHRQLPRFLRMMNRAGFTEDRQKGEKRIWRPVPGRAWHAKSKGRIGTSREVVLIHTAS